MRRIYRLTLTAAALATSLGTMSGLTWFSSKSEGPLEASLDWVGTTLGSIEHRIRQNLKGGLGRNSQLAWFAQYRVNPDRLRQPGTVLLGAYDSGLPGTLDGVVGFEHALGTTLPLVH